jgi:hypothetical protein
MAKCVIAWVLISFTATSVWAQSPPPVTQPPVPIDAATIYSHLIFLESRVETLSTQVRDAATADLASQHQISLQVEAVHELIVVEAAKPNPMVGLLTNRTFWELAGGLAASLIILVQQRSKP